ncbi:MAG: CinA family nicotinamide mononucleotide deamidase-related protein [Gemmatimonadota bacterium]|nr:CinA family nicotinamide mononucleotide deamidase-related protein [Gemmatimonadota bacterium]
MTDHTSTDPGQPSAAIVTVGDELLYGETVDTNGAWLGRELTSLGFAVIKRYAVSDDDAAIRTTVGSAMGEAEIVLVTGGLGPTRDDITRDAVAGLLALDVHEDPELRTALEQWFRAYGYDRLPEPNRSQARVPDGARILPNRHGTAPGLALERDGGLVVLLPGVPREMKGIFEEVIRPLVRSRFGNRLVPYHHRVLHTSGVPESRLAELVDEALPSDLEGVRVAFLPDPLGVDLRLTSQGSPEDAERRLDAVEAILAPVIEPWHFEGALGDLAEAVVGSLRAGSATLAVAESCTGGLMAHRITSFAGVSDVFLGGVVTYANRAKVSLCGVSPEDLERHGAVSEAVARGMALGVARALGADYGVGITGVAGPTGGTEEKPVGTVWTAIASRGDVVARRRRFPGDRHDVQARAVQDAFRLLRDRIRGLGNGN